MDTYDTRRREVERAFNMLGRGSRSEASFDEHILLATISHTLTGRVRNEEVLDKLENWVNGEGASRFRAKKGLSPVEIS